MNMMDQLIDTKNLRKINILRVLQSTNNLSLAVLSDKIGINEKTMLTDIDKLQEDLTNYAIKADLIVDENKLVVLNRRENFSLSKLYKKYMQETVYFRLLDAIFNGKYLGLKQASLDLDISLTSLYRKLYTLEDAIEEFDLTIDRQSDLFILGKEENIRVFMFNMYWKSLELFDWHFDEELKIKSETMYQQLIGQFHPNFSLVFQRKMILWIAIGLRRMAEGFYLSEFFHEKLDSCVIATLTYERFHTAYIQEFPEFDEAECLFLYVVMISDPAYSEKADFISSTIHFRDQQRSDFEEMSLNFISEMTTFVNHTLEDNDYLILYKNLLAINLFYDFFGVRSILFSRASENHLLEEKLLERFPDFPVFYNKFLKKFPEYQRYDVNATYYKYIRAILTSVSNSFFYPELKISLAIDANKKTTDLLKQKLLNISPVPICFVEYDDPAVDLMIANIDIGLEGIPFVLITDPLLHLEEAILSPTLIKIAQKKKAAL
jgi:DNA-binding Lrp family transcriptional regulator